jgi:hypothetical protein
MESQITQARDVLVPVLGEVCVQFAFVRGLLTSGDQNYQNVNLRVTVSLQNLRIMQFTNFHYIRLLFQ